MAIVALIGRPNVGKSSLFNRMVGERKAIEATEAGTTRDRVYGQVKFNDREFTIIDAAGIGKDQLKPNNELDLSVKEQIEAAKVEADLIVLVADVQEGLTEEDRKLADIVRQLKKPVIVAVNKSDHPKYENQSYEFERLGFKKVIATSAIHNSGIHELLLSIVKELPSTKSTKMNINEICVALIGRPNVGKSTLLNQYAGSKRAVVSSVAGTTRDAIDISINYKENVIRFIDTAGIRRRGKIEVGIEKFSVIRSVKAIEESDVVILLIDAIEGPTAGDAHIAGLVIEYGKGLVLAVNKWDELIKDKPLEEDVLQRKYLAKLQDTFAFVPWAPAIFISAKDGLNGIKLLEQAWKIAKIRKVKFSKEDLDLIKSVAETNHPHLPMIYYIEQSDINPPTFDVVINRPQTWHFSNSRFIENIIRDINPLYGTPIKIRTIAKNKL